MSHPFESFIGYGIKQFFRAFNDLYDQKLADYGLTAAQVNVLEQLWTAGDGQTQKQLHERLRIRPASLTNLLDTLVEGGWVARKLDAGDARLKRIFLTEQGLAQRDICMGMIIELEQLVRQGMIPEEVSLMLVWLNKMRQNLPE
ncbi:MarR family winged helix-turn-helix transcriptional regulator [Paenibacillus sp. MMS18-CY102]|uniref:MarR family winged helix-turn-helix transcriptional regulator n=1 Tax=Paenibacillus sp. MMS18-CY102 TaxID=2682849 RepID=UPI0013661399|nr:MarR family transcriptional regulator [Paenibacillus sp. MMS18-CY102]MWC28827.1 MarR family transcriptional regulator [Paenibacillus sp. MMS18-CY102]